MHACTNIFRCMQERRLCCMVCTLCCIQLDSYGSKTQKNRLSAFDPFQSPTFPGWAFVVLPICIHTYMHTCMTCVVCINAYMHIYMYMHTYIHTCMHLYAYIHSTCTHTHTHSLTQLILGMFSRRDICTYVCMCVCIYI